MKKFLTKLLVTTILLALLSQTALAAFNDVFPADKNYQSITYLQENGIINGYPDGTFRPANNVNRAEFLKIILEGSNIIAEITSPTPFPDVNHNEWYGKYVIKAYYSDWIIGYPDGTFRPEQTINKVEALKILGKVQKWTLPQGIDQKPFEDTPLGEWYIPYVAYAKEHGFLEESGSFFNPGSDMTRANISEIIYRSLTLAPQPLESTTTGEGTLATDIQGQIELIPTSDNEPPTTVDQPIEDETAFTPENFTVIEPNFFDNITLDQALPNIFYKNEVYLITGTLLNSNDKEATAILSGTSNSQYESYTGDATNQRFKITVHFDRAGNYNFGVLPGESGTTKAAAISVLAELPDTAGTGNTTAPSALTVSYAQDKTTVSFNSPSGTIKKLTFKQNNNAVTYLSRQNTNTIPVKYAHFQNFNDSSVTYFMESASLSSEQPLTIASAFSKSGEKTFMPEEHSFDDISDQITSNPPDTFTNIQTISFSGTVNTDAFEEAYIIKPDGLVEMVILSSTSPKSSHLDKTTILAGGAFKYTYTPSKEGRYIAEINDKEGKPILNHPIYMGGKIPLLPDYFDINTRTLFEGNFSTTEARQTLLYLINKARTDHGFQPVTMADELNSLAQAHSNDMRDRNFFGHVNPDGKTPDDRRLDAGIKTGVGENLAKDTSTEAVHYGLMRSASHRENILKPEWTRVGLGMTEDNGYIVTAEEFSTSEITATDLANFKNQLYTGINEKRQTIGLPALTIKTNVEGAAKYLNDKKIIEGQDLDSATFSEATNANGLSGSSAASSMIASDWPSILGSIINEETRIQESQWQSIGADIQTDTVGSIHLILVLNSQS